MADRNQQQTWSVINDESETKAEKGGCGKVACSLFLLLFAWLAFALSAQAASFDCAKARTKVEKLICANSSLSQLDDELNIAYQWALIRTENQLELVKKQRYWLKSVRDACQTSNESCLTRAIIDRTKELTTLARGKGCYTLEPVFDDEKGKLRPIEPVCRVLEQNLNQFCDQPPMVSGLKIAPKFHDLLKLPEWTPLDPEANRSLIEAFIRASWVDARLMSDAEKDKRWEYERLDIEKAFAEKRITFSQAQLDLYNLGKNQTAYRLDYGRESFTMDNIKLWRKRKAAPIIIQHAPEIIISLYKYIIEGRVDILGELFIYDGMTYSYWINGEYTTWKSPPYHVSFDIFRTDRQLRDVSRRPDLNNKQLMLHRDHICTFHYKSPQEAQQ